MGNCCRVEQPKTANADSSAITFSNLNSKQSAGELLQEPVSELINDRNQESSCRSDRLLVVAIDVGTTFTGYAYSFCYDRHQMYTYPWAHGKGVSEKAPTAILLTPDQEMKSFGYDALRDYAELAENGMHHDYYFFHKFKMVLYEEQKQAAGELLQEPVKELIYERNQERKQTAGELPQEPVSAELIYDRNQERGNGKIDERGAQCNVSTRQDNISIYTTISDSTGKKMTALAVFSKLLRYLRNHVINRLQERDTAAPITEDDIHWVVTVPAIWNDKAKCFMRRAMNEAGIENDRSSLALEPEAASVYCKYIPVRDADAKLFQHFQSGTRYMVVDLGGGTVDVTIHSVNEDGTLEELHQPSGGYWGGTTVDKEFRSTLKTILQSTVYEKMLTDCADDVLELDTNFEIKKHEYKLEAQDIKLRFPSRIVDLYNETMGESIQDRLSSCEYSNEITQRRDKWSISSQQYKNFFFKSIRSISNHIDELLKGPAKGIHCILLVGGYSQSEIVSSGLRQRFPTIRFIKPEEPWLAVLKGAVLFGHQPHAISARVCRRTYGIAIQTRFDESRHNINRRLRANDGYCCDDVFDRHLKIGEIVKIDEKRQAKSYFVPPNSKYAVLDVYTSTDVRPRYVTDNSCSKLGSLVIEFDEITERGDQVDVTLNYRGTELSVDVREQKTGKTTSARLDFVG